MELDFELARAEGAPAGLLCLRIERLQRFEGARRSAVLAALAQLVTRRAAGLSLHLALRGEELLAFGRGLDAPTLDRLAKELVLEARKLEPAGEPQPLRLSLSAGYAATRAGLDLWFETLDAVAREGAEVASAQGGECAVHSELYELTQRRIERTRGARAPLARKPSAPAESAPAVAPASTQAHAPQAATPGVRAAAHGATVVHAAPVAPVIAGATSGIDLGAIEARVAELARAAFERALDEQAQRFRGEMELYERRLAKLQKALSESEQEKQALVQRGPLDGGLASTFREVQGLSSAERDYALKLGLLQQIAAANLDLNERLKRSA